MHQKGTGQMQSKISEKAARGREGLFLVSDVHSGVEDVVGVIAFCC